MSETAATTITANEAAPKHSRLAWLDALRGFAALCVVFDHGSTLMLRPVRDFLYRWLDLGEYGVFVFFLVSGYIIPASLERKGSVRGFWTSRLFRLYPLYVVGPGARRGGLPARVRHDQGRASTTRAVGVAPGC